jgi:hypothetical protein
MRAGVRLRTTVNPPATRIDDRQAAHKTSFVGRLHLSSQASLGIVNE